MQNTRSIAKRFSLALAVTAMPLLPSISLAVTPIQTIQPVTSINYLVHEEGIFSNLGLIDMFGGNFAPGGEHFADGSLLSITQNTALFSQVGTIYGGDGVTTFALPDLDGRIPIGIGQGAGLTNRTIGDQVGSDTVTLSNTNLPVGIGGGSGTPFNNMQPSLALTYVISLQGIFPSQGGGGGAGGDADPYIGQVFLDAAPNVQNNLPGFMTCSGQTLAIDQYVALFSVLGTQYGGNGVTTFQLPNLNGRTVIGAGDGAGLTPRNVGESLGTEATTLAQSNLPAPNGSDTPFSNMQPSLSLNYMIALEGIFPSPGGGSVFDLGSEVLGQITLFAGNFAPSGWALCDGQLLSITQNTALFSLLGTTYGGNGVTTFALPDLRGRAGFDADFGVGLNGLEGLALGGETGTETIQLTASQTPTITVPEPASLGLLAIAAVGLLARRRRQA